MTLAKKWPEKYCHFLMYWQRYYTMLFIADLLKREFDFEVTRDSCIGKYNRLKKSGFKYDPVVVNDYMRKPK